jgi:hypothetical protein
VAHGEYPVSLDAIDPPLAAALLADPWSGRPLGYRRLGGDTGPGGPAYLLYSVGFDGADNGGQVNGESNTQALLSAGSGADFLLCKPPMPDPKE